MFKIKLSESYFWPVTFGIALDGGKVDKQTFEVAMRRLGTTRIAEILGEAGAGKIKAADVCREIVIGWKDVVDENKEPVPFSTSALDQLIEVPGFAAGVSDAFLESIKGERAKN